jgi:hypothetical protein
MATSNRLGLMAALIGMTMAEPSIPIDRDIYAGRGQRYLPRHTKGSMTTDERRTKRNQAKAAKRKNRRK